MIVALENYYYRKNAPSLIGKLVSREGELIQFSIKALKSMLKHTEMIFFEKKTVASHA